MSKYVLQGGRKLQGELAVHGAKNAALPLLAATILGAGESVLHGCPHLSDVDAAIRILDYLGCGARRAGDTVTVDTANLTHFDVPEDLMREMRSSIVFLGAIVSRLGKTRLSFPGGCEIGTRPIDLHLMALRTLGLQIKDEHGYLDCSVDGRLRGAPVTFSFPSVGATENTMLAAVTAEGITTITNAAREPEIIDLAQFLNKCGAKISGAGEGTIVIEGVERLHGAEHTVIPDRIAATTYLCAAAVTHGDILLTNVVPAQLASVLTVFEQTGCSVRVRENAVRLAAPERLRAVDAIRTMPYPGFPTDAQAPIMAMLTLAEGSSMFVENIFESRYKHVPELIRLGANIKTEGRVAIVEGVSKLTSAKVSATDLRGGAALVVAGLAAEGETQVDGLRHIDRGYDGLEENLVKLGAAIRRE